MLEVAGLWRVLARCGLGFLLGVVFSMAAFADTVPVIPSSDAYRDVMLAITEGRLEDAKLGLLSLTQTEPRHAGAWLDLAMLFCATGHASTAEDLFTEIELRFSPPAPIVEVIARQRKLGCLGRQAKNTATLRLGYGSENNVNQGASSPYFSIGSGPSQIDLLLLPAYLPRSDTFWSAGGEWVREFSPGGVTGVVGFESRRYAHLQGYDTSSVSLGAEWPLRWGQWGVKAAGSVGFSTLGGQAYLQQSQVRLEAFLPVPLPEHMGASVKGGWSEASYVALSGFDAQLLEASAGLTYYKNNVGWHAKVGVLRDQARGDRPGGDRMGRMVGWQSSWPLGRGVVGELGGQWQQWQDDQVYSAGLIDVKRQQTTQMLRVAAVFKLNAEQSVAVEWRGTQNAENISIFSFGARGVQVSWRWQPLGLR